MIGFKKGMLVTAACLFFATRAVAADATPDAAAAGEKAVEASAGIPSTWDQLGFGLGLSFTFDLGANDRVKSAEIVDGTVRVTDVENSFPRVVLEGHYFFERGIIGYGPFVAIQPGDDEIVSAAAMGVMVGFRKDNKVTESWNMGLGVVADPNIRVLGDGFKENQPPPGTETEVRFKEKTQYGVMLLFSSSWQ